MPNNALKRLWKRSGILLHCSIEVTDHALLRLYDRWKFKSFRAIIDTSNVYLYPDLNEPFVYYMNIAPRGYLVLRRVEETKFVVVTITETEQRNFGDPLILSHPRLRERQMEYTL